MKSRRWLLILGILFAFFCLPAFLAWNLLIGPVLEVNAQYRGLLGKDESQVMATLGQPRFRVTAVEAKQHGVDYPWREFHYEPVPDRPVEKEVLLYNASDKSFDRNPFAVYIFIGNDGKVAAVDFAGK